MAEQLPTDLPSIIRDLRVVQRGPQEYAHPHHRAPDDITGDIMDEIAEKNMREAEGAIAEFSKKLHDNRLRKIAVCGKNLVYDEIKAMSKHLSKHLAIEDLGKVIEALNETFNDMLNNEGQQK